MKNLILISSSLSENSLSAKLVNYVESRIDNKKIQTKIIDLREFNIPFCDGRNIENYNLSIRNLYNEIKNCDFLIFGFPVYCYSISGVMKNFLDIFSLAMKDKYFAVCASAGSKMSYLAISDLYKILKFQSNATGVMPNVLVSNSDIQNGIFNKETEKLVSQMLSSLIKSDM